MRINRVKLAIMLLLTVLLAVSAGCRNREDDTVVFRLDVDSIRIEGGVSDTLSPPVTAELDGLPVSLTGGDYDETVDMSGRTGFTLEARDGAGNTSQLTVEKE